KEEKAYICCVTHIPKNRPFRLFISDRTAIPTSSDGAQR
ncbi:hypothetical protein M2101_002426, partial [Parabacteroides sp. PM5-20]|nr:hypothetical protein [Parabacteroides sp. PM5-20]